MTANLTPDHLEAFRAQTTGSEDDARQYLGRLAEGIIKCPDIKDKYADDAYDYARMFPGTAAGFLAPFPADVADRLQRVIAETGTVVELSIAASPEPPPTSLSHAS